MEHKYKSNTYRMLLLSVMCSLHKQTVLSEDSVNTS
jgi:hypothetical protein